LPEKNKFTVNGLSPGHSYRFKIRARNACGFSKWSATTTLYTAFCPTAPKPPKIGLSDKDVTIEWEKPVVDTSRKFADISGYTVQLQQRNGDFIGALQQNLFKECSKLTEYKDECKAVPRTIAQLAADKKRAELALLSKVEEKPVEKPKPKPRKRTRRRPRRT